MIYNHNNIVCMGNGFQTGIVSRIVILIKSLQHITTTKVKQKHNSKQQDHSKWCKSVELIYFLN